MYLLMTLHKIRSLVSLKISGRATALTDEPPLNISDILRC